MGDSHDHYHHDHYEKSIRGQAAWLAENEYFERFINSLIVVSAIQMGVEADLPRDASLDDVRLALQACDVFLVFSFFGEMSLKILAYDWYYFYDSWNWLDFLISWVSVFSLVMVPILEATGTGSLQGFDVMRTFRLLRLIRMAKMMKTIPELMMVMDGLVASMKSMIWVFLLLFLVVYVMAIYCVENIGREDSGDYPFESNLTLIKENSQHFQLFNSYEFFGNIPRAMVTLFSITLVAEWQEVVRPVFESQQYHIPAFLLLVVITSFGIVNVIIGVICEKTNESMVQLELLKDEENRNNQCTLIDQLSQALFDIDVDADGSISKAEFVRGGETYLTNTFEEIGLPKGFSFEDLHTMLDVDGSGQLSKEEFMDGMYRLIVGNEFQRACTSQLMMGQIKHSTHSMKEDLDTLRKKVGVIKGLAANRPRVEQASGARGEAELTVAAAPRSIQVQSASDGGRSSGKTPLDAVGEELWRRAEGERQEAERILSQAHEEQRNLQQEKARLAQTRDALQERERSNDPQWGLVRNERRSLQEELHYLRAEQEETTRSVEQAEAERRQAEGKWQHIVKERDQVRDAWRGLRSEFARAEERWQWAHTGGQSPPPEAPLR